MRGRWIVVYIGGLLLLLIIGATFTHPVPQAASAAPADQRSAALPRANEGDDDAHALFEQGRRTFRFDTFGDQAFWGDTLKLYKAIEGAKLGGVGPGVSPKTALGVGLKVDLDALPHSLVEQIEQGKFDLDDPAVSLVLLKLNAVIGIKGFFNPSGTLKSV